MASISYLLDISRLLARADYAVPTGIDRVELSYAQYLLTHKREQSYFCAMHPVGIAGGIPTPLAKEMIEALAAKWGGSTVSTSASRLKRKIRRKILYSPLPKKPHMVHILVSHHHLTRPRVIKNILKRTGAKFVPILHDLIPLEYPEYARPGEPNRHAARVQTILDYAAGIIFPSHAVRDAFMPYMEKHSRQLPIGLVPLGVNVKKEEDLLPPTLACPSRPYFVCLSTIEPRKNHLLLLQAWRRLAEQFGDRAPVLVVIGKRGWENENIVDLLDRCPSLKGHVLEYNELPDQDVIHLLKNCRALLFPTFSEGFGLPLAEAFSFGVPVLCSDIPVLREVGAGIADYLDPLDGPAWIEAILDYTTNSARRRDQIQRINYWKPFTWGNSIFETLNAICEFKLFN